MYLVDRGSGRLPLSLSAILFVLLRLASGHSQSSAPISGTNCHHASHQHRHSLSPGSVPALVPGRTRLPFDILSHVTFFNFTQFVVLEITLLFSHVNGPHVMMMVMMLWWFPKAQYMLYACRRYVCPSHSVMLVRNIFRSKQHIIIM